MSAFNESVPEPDLSVWRPWAGSLLEAPTTLKCYNLHALTIVIITKYIYIYFYTFKIYKSKYEK